MSSWLRIGGLNILAPLLLLAPGCGVGRDPLLGQRMDLRHEIQHKGVTTVLELDQARVTAGPNSFLEVTFTIRNQSSQPHSFAFSSSQEYDFAVLDRSQDERWRWSSGRFFAMRMAVKTLGQEPWVYRETIPTVDSKGQPLPPGEYLLWAGLAGVPAVSNRIHFEVD